MRKGRPENRPRSSPCPLTEIEVVEPISVGQPAAMPPCPVPILSSPPTSLLSLLWLYSRPSPRSLTTRLGSNIIADWNCHRVRPSFAAGQNHSLIFGFNSHVNISLSLSALPIVIAASWPTATAAPLAPAQCVVRGHRGSERVVARARLLAPRVTKTRAVPPRSCSAPSSVRVRTATPWGETRSRLKTMNSRYERGRRRTRSV